ncbi:glycosyltransferase family 2 protein [Hydnomerulius pinastri MD-312]|uniref:Glycosyltransferase family 2 protein n=1 Tax=Hydnomerulius pinastri MD-312 TaxID=994086 RepID=A0A0C9WAT4_9AGAM|nr:glycosyltransferase family 2 protein [Hydnomerulius pinastri MD-312]
MNPVQYKPPVFHGPRKFLVTGGNGFIGSHVAKALYDRGEFVRVLDIHESSEFSESISNETFIGNLCDASVCDQAVRDIDTVLHFAATMGGMGMIHEGNDFSIYPENASMTSNILFASIRAGVRVFFYASSACVYPGDLQDDPDSDVSLAEKDVWASGAPKPQGLYGLEKLVSELLIQQSCGKMQVRIARFHNVFGPRGAWMNGREKVPAALLRKALAIRLAGEFPADLEIWGDGTQRRSFLFINDCVEAVLLLLESNCTNPVNIGSDRSISIEGLAQIAIRCAGLREEDVHFRYVVDSKPIGVSSRNSNNDLVKQTLGWSPSVILENGMNETAEWMKREMETVVADMKDSERALTLRKLQVSELVDLTNSGIKFAILLPITSRGSNPPEECLFQLASFAKSLARTTSRDTQQLGGQRFFVKVYVAIDKGDPLLDDQSELNKAESVLVSQGICDVAVEFCIQPPGRVCAIWRQIAKRAWEDGCDYLVLMGDDVVLKDEGWMRDAHAEFADIAKREGVPHGFGCVAFTDVTFPGMPTFPIIHRTHLDIFDGNVIPEIFINQDGDPFLYQLYRRWNCSTMFPARILNEIGGSRPARYRQQHADGWTFNTLDDATDTAEQWLREHCPAASRKLTMDIVIPSYRVQLPFLGPILTLKPSSTCTVMFIVIVDDPHSTARFELENKYACRPDVRIRVNTENLGASASRNRGIKESAAEWIIFLDDDIAPRADLLIEAEKIIRAHPKAAGFIGNAHFPPADSIFTTAVHLAGVTYFWDIATKMPGETDMPWGVTANLIARRVDDGVEYNLQFPKTGGGEDIDFCRQKRQFSIDNGGEGFHPSPEVVVTHPWWSGGKRSYWRFYMWSKGDGGLIKLYPELTYFDHAPNSAECLLISCVLASVGVPVYLFTSVTFFFLVAIYLGVATVVANIAHDVYRHLFRNADRAMALNSTVGSVDWVLAVIESSLIRMASECGRVVGLLERNEILLLGRRFDWFTGRAGEGPMREERMNARQRFGIIANLLVVALAVLHWLWLAVPDYSRLHNGLDKHESHWACLLLFGSPAESEHSLAPRADYTNPTTTRDNLLVLERRSSKLSVTGSSRVFRCFKWLERAGDRVTGAAGPYFVGLAVILISLGTISFLRPGFIDDAPRYPGTGFLWASPSRAQRRLVTSGVQWSSQEVEIAMFGDATRGINQCVGLHNERHFVLFMVYLVLATFFLSYLGYPHALDALGITYVPWTHTLPQLCFILTYMLSVVLCIAVAIMLLWHLWGITRGETSVEAQDHGVYRKVAEGRGDTFVNSYDLGKRKNLQMFFNIGPNGYPLYTLFVPFRIMPYTDGRSWARREGLLRHHGVREGEELTDDEEEEP